MWELAIVITAKRGILLPFRFQKMKAALVATFLSVSCHWKPFVFTAVD